MNPAHGAPGAVPLGELAFADERPALIEPGRARVSYAELDALADGVATRLLSLGLGRGDRVGLQLRRSIDAVAAILGVLRAGCAYVPVDPRAPIDRNASILEDCRVRATLVEEPFAASFRAAADAGAHVGELLAIGAVGAGEAVGAWTAGAEGSRRGEPSELACLLYTSGSTGRPKGWRMTRAAVEVHARWCREFLQPGAGDVFANHAQFNFGMSLFDIFSSLSSGAALLLVPDEIRQFAPRVVDLLERERVTIWFSGPAILGLIAELPDLSDRDLGALRSVAFAGEVFPAPAMQALRRRLPHPRMFNFYGSTETNVALWHELRSDTTHAQPAPIGRPCAHFEARVVGLDGAAPARGEVGELQLRGEGLAAGYLERPELDAERLLPAVDGGLPWFRTCDLVRELDDGELAYAGRLGRMVKLRGYRVEPGEIERRLHEHPRVAEAAVVPADGPRGLQLVAHVGGPRLSVVELKEFCAVTLPAYMIPERFRFHDALPRTLRGKVDLVALREQGEAGDAAARGESLTRP